MSTPDDRDAPTVDARFATAAERLESWKEIAAYLGRGITTVQRWEQEEGLPVHRLPHAKRGSVFAFKSELDDWRTERAQQAARRSPSANDDQPPQPATGRRRSQWLLVGGVLLAVAIGVTIVGAIRHRPSVAEVGHESDMVPRPVANDSGRESGPSLSPDGSKVVYTWDRADGHSDLYIKSIDGGEPQRLTVEEGRSFQWPWLAKWSPTGDLIAFVGVERTDSYGLYVIGPSGGPVRRLTTLAGIGLSWHPDGQSIAFADRNSNGEPFSIFSISLATGQRRRLTAPPSGTFGDTMCAYSPDGSRLAVARFGTRSDADLYVATIEASKESPAERWTWHFVGIEGLDWTPAGDAIVLGSWRGLWKVNATGPSGGAPTLIVDVPGAATQPSFSRATTDAPSRLVYQYQTNDVNIWRWDASSPAVHRRLPGSIWWEDFPAFSPDRQRIAFASNRTGANEIWTASGDGLEPRQITFHRGPLVIAPQWSPDGQRLVFSSQVAGNRHIYSVNVDGSDSVRLTTEPSLNDNPVWSRDGRWIYFRSDRSGFNQIWRMTSNGGDATAVTAGEASQAFESPDGRLLYFVRGVKVSGLWSIPVSGGRESLALPDVLEGFWGVADPGIYFIVTTPELSPEGPSLRFFSFSSHSVTTLSVLPSMPGSVLAGFSVSRDGASVLWTHNDNLQQDVMMIDKWRR